MKHLCVPRGVIISTRPFRHSILLTSRVPHLCIRTLCASAAKPPDTNFPAEDRGVSPLQRWKDVGKTVGRNTMQAVSTTAKNWWDRYEEFVGVVEVREAQGHVGEAEKDFMVARGIVREARESVEVQQVKLKEVRDRLDRVSRDDVQYLELATLEHKLLQEKGKPAGPLGIHVKLDRTEEKRLRASYIHAEESEREKFSLFSASVRESHEKERTRAERTKNWSIIGSVLGAIIGVMGSTYINRVRLQELKTLLLEAQKGPISLQEAIQEHASVHQNQQRDLGELILALGNLVPTVLPSSPETQKGGSAIPVNSSGSADQTLKAIKEHATYTKETGKHLEHLQQQYSNLEKSIHKIATDVQNVKSSVSARTAELPVTAYVPGDGGEEAPLQNVIFELADAEGRLGAKITRNSIYSTALTCTVVALTLPVMYILLKGN